MMKLLRFLLGAMLLFVVVAVAAFVYLKWWQALIVVLAMILAIVVGVKLLLRNLGKILGNSMLKMFEVKSQVLRGASAEVHRVEPTPPPPRDEQSDDEEAPPQGANWYRIDVTITPTATAGPMHHWDLSDLRLVPADTPPTTMKTLSEMGDLEQYALQKVQIMTGGRFADDEMGKYEGPQQIRVLVAVAPHVRELKFQYYAEQFGLVPLPSPLPNLR